MPDHPARKRVSVVVTSLLSIIAVLASIVAISMSVDTPIMAPPAAAQTTSDAAPSAAPDAAPAADASAPAEPAVEAPVVEGDVSQIRNVVLMYGDDLDWLLFNEVPRMRELMDRGTTLTNFVVTESLCCPSRASIYRGQYVHNHKVVSNMPATGGGWQTFYDLGRQKECLPVWLSRAGVQTSHVGKYLNGFPGQQLKPTYTPPGWANFISTTRGPVAYTGYNYTLNTNGTLRKYGRAPGDFLEDVLTTKAASLITSAREPFFLEFPSYLPHAPAPAAPRFAGSRAGSTVPRPPNFNARGTSEPAWLREQRELGPRQQANLDVLWTRRLESAETLADSFHRLLATLEATGHADDTLVIITSDNGYHVGTHRIPSGKHTPYREDSVVPAVFIGPGIAQGVTIDAMTSTIDLAPTIAALQGAETPTWLDGRNLMPLLTAPDTTPWRTGVLTENLAPTTPDDPDYSGFEAPKYSALRTTRYLYVNYGREQGAALYDLANDPYELDNIVSTTDPAIVAQLAEQTRALAACRGDSCRVADSLPAGVPTLPEPEAPEPTATPSTAAPTP